MGVALAGSSTLVIVRLLQQRKQLFEPFGRLVIGVLLLQDLLVILLMPLVSAVPRGGADLAVDFTGTAALVALTYAVSRWIAPWLLRLRTDGEALLLSVLALLFLFIGTGDLPGVPVAVGAFLAGVALSPFPVQGIARGKLRSLADFFSAIFFLALGGLLIPPTARELWLAGALALVVLTVTPVLVTAVTVVTMVLPPFLATEPVIHRLLRLHPLRREEPGAGPPERHVLLLGCGSGGMPLLETLLAGGATVVVVVDDPEVIERLRQGDVRCSRGDAADPDVLRRAGADRARLVSSTVRRPRDNERLFEVARGIPVLVRVFDEADAAWVRERGAVPIVYSEAAEEDFIRWFARTHGKEHRALEDGLPTPVPAHDPALS